MHCISEKKNKQWLPLRWEVTVSLSRLLKVVLLLNNTLQKRH